MRVGALLLAGGLGTRLFPLTKQLPKPMIPLLGKPLLEHIITNLVGQGVEDIVIAVGYQGEVIERYFGDGSRFNCRIRYSREDKPLGTGGAIRKGGLLFDHTFLVLNADILQDFALNKLVAFHQETGASTTIGLMMVKDPRSFGLVELGPSGRVQRFVEKPKTLAEVTSPYVNAGIYVMEPEVLAYIPDSKQVSVERETFPALLAAGEPVYGFPMSGVWHDLGTRERYLKVHQDLLQTTKPAVQSAPDAVVHKKAKLIPPVWIGPGCQVQNGAEVGPFAFLGAGCQVKSGAKVKESVLWDQVIVGPGACVIQSVLGNTVSVPPAGRLIGQLVCPESLEEAIRRSL
ncbi:MAG: NDP-sugar synthase [Firmicutes bacterium]|nr:NDP-sugar synthase [Bacillota bacterium]